MTIQIYAINHVALLAAISISALWRAKRKEPLIYFATDTLYLMLAFVLVGGGAMLALRFMA